MSELHRKTQQQQQAGCKKCSQQQQQRQQQPVQPRNYSPQNMFSIEQPTSQTGPEHDGSPNGSFSSSVQQNGFNASFHQDMDSPF